jgi:hypothetical protein
VFVSGWFEVATVPAPPSNRKHLRTLRNVQNLRNNFLFLQKWQSTLRSSNVSLEHATIVTRGGDHTPKETLSYHCPKYTLQLEYNIRVLPLQSMFLYELRELAKMSFLVKHLTPELGLGHDPVEMGRNNSVKRTRKDEEMV